MSLNRFSFILIVFCFGSWSLISWIIIKDYISEFFLGMIVPLVIGLLTVTKIQSIFTSDPGKLTSFMMKSFIGKLVIYGVYMMGIVAFSPFNERPFFIRSVFKGSRARDDNSSGK